MASSLASRPSLGAFMPAISRELLDGEEPPPGGGGPPPGGGGLPPDPEALGTHWTWGQNANAKTGRNTTTGNTLVPTQVGSSDIWKQMSGGFTSSAGLRSDGTLWTWGSNMSGRTAQNTDAGTTMVPTQVGTDTDWDNIAQSNAHGLAIKTDGTLWAWGTNNSGRTGLNTVDGVNLVPVQVGTDTDWARCFAPVSANFSFALKSDGTLWSCGNNADGRTAQGTTTGNTLIFTQVGTATWATVGLGCSFNGYAIRSDGTLWAWGFNGNGRNGNGLTTGNTPSPEQIGADTDWAAVAGGNASGIARKSNGTLWSWGSNADGTTGLDTTTGNTFDPTQIGTDDDWAAVRIGAKGSDSVGGHSHAIKANGTLWSWGTNGNGETGLNTGNTSPVLVPTQVGADTDWEAVSGGDRHSHAIRAAA